MRPKAPSIWKPNPTTGSPTVTFPADVWNPKVSALRIAS
jgi:hypothetical protein